MKTLNLGESASDGTGMMMSTLAAVARLLTLLFACHEWQRQTGTGSFEAKGMKTGQVRRKQGP
jgi:hypothetical protein